MEEKFTAQLSKKLFLSEINKRLQYEKNKAVINEWQESRDELVGLVYE